MTGLVPSDNKRCGSFLGSKVWHSTDQYRRTIWQCNGKFSNEERCHTPTLGTEIERQLEETQVIAEMIKVVVKENTSTAQSREVYLKKYEALTERYEKAAAELERLQIERTARTQQDKKIALFIRTFKKLPDTMTK